MLIIIIIIIITIVIMIIILEMQHGTVWWKIVALITSAKQKPKFFLMLYKFIQTDL